jgi:hypothetical protein
LQTCFIMLWYGVGFWLWPWLLALTVGMAIGMAKWGVGLAGRALVWQAEVWGGGVFICSISAVLVYCPC